MKIDRPWLPPFCYDTNDGEIHVFQSRGLKIIGVRLYPYDGQDGENKRKAKCIQKSLYGKTNWFYFNDGFSIREDNDRVTEIDVDVSAFDADNLLYSEPYGVKISLSAIVGANGTGKSTLVDTLVRLINNLSAAILGEDYVYSSAQHLHYIDNMYASLAVYRDHEIKVLTCKGRRLELTTYKANEEALAQEYTSNSDYIVEHYTFFNTDIVLDGSLSEESVLPPQDKKQGLLYDWFYTLVSNYSLYAYNYRDYIYEQTNEQRLATLRTERPRDNKEEDKFWLKGVFHKNDGYQTPVVIHPMRENGYINANKVNYLGKQNLISLCFDKRGYYFPFRLINQTHHIVAFYVYHKKHEKYRGFIDSCLVKHFRYDEVQRNIFCRLEMPIKQFWSLAIGVEYKKHVIYDWWQQAWDYLAYKTIKVLWTYKQYAEIWKNAVSATDYNEERFKNSLSELLKDNSNRTQKIRRVVSYLRFCDEPNYYLRKGPVIDVDDIYQWMSTIIGMPLYPSRDNHTIDVEDLLPPPFVDVVLQLVDNEHLENYNHDKPNCKDIIPFEGLSSGERQIAYSLGNIIYHLKNIESGGNDDNSSKGHVTSLKYKYVNIMLDEVELYFHPDLQRRFISLLLDSIKGLQMKFVQGVNITIVTHSPFVLSDIPRSNILCLSREPNHIAFDKTFAANIHDLFNNTFILPYTIGEYAQRKISELIKRYNVIKAGTYSRSDWSIDASHFCQQPELSKLKYLSEIIGDSYLSVEARDMVNEIENWIPDNNLGNETD